VTKYSTEICVKTHNEAVKSMVLYVLWSREMVGPWSV